MKRKIYCTNVHLRIIEILITLMYNLSAVTAAVTLSKYKWAAWPTLRVNHLTEPHIISVAHLGPKEIQIAEGRKKIQSLPPRP